MLLVKLDERIAVPKYQQIVDQIVEMIERDVLKAGARLPSSRSLSLRLGVNRSTVYKAYQELWALGYVDSRPGSYSYVRRRLEIRQKEAKEVENAVDWDLMITEKARLSSDLYREAAPAGLTDQTIDFTPLSADPRLLPVEDFRKCFNSVLKQDGAKLLLYSDPLGNPGLRQFIADRMRIHSIAASTDEIILTNGAQQAIELILKLLVRSNQPVFLEEPSYSSAIPLFRFYSDRLTGIPMEKSGMDLEMLEKAIRKERPAVVYTMPNFQNPMGITTNQEHRENLLKICLRYQIPLIEDGFEEELKYYGKAILPIKSMDRNHLVFYVGTFSKSLFPGLRIGWIVADKRCIERLTALKATCDISGNQANQAALNLFCRMGYYDLHIKRIHRIYRKRMQTALKILKDRLPTGRFEYTLPVGGYTFWIEIKQATVEEKVVIRRINEHGVTVSPGSVFFPDKTQKVCFRLSIAHRNDEEIEEGLNRVIAALKEI